MVANDGSIGFSRAGPREFFALLKPRVMSLSIFTAFVGMVAAPGPVPNPGLAAISLLAIALGAGASGALNMWWDADIDKVMNRTKDRPIPAGLVNRPDAFGFGLFLSVLAVLLLALASNYLAAGLLAFTIFFYAVIYSMFLKRSTPQNIVIGGAAGALPPVVGWAAVTGTAPVEAWALFAIIFLWTPPHFWALNLFTQTDYDKAGIPMLPNVKGIDRAKLEIVAYSVALLVASAVPVLLGSGSWLYGAAAGFAGLYFLFLAGVLHQASDDEGIAAASKRLFGFSIFYLFLLFLAILLENWMGLNG